MANTCHSCATDITDLHIICQGFCNAVFHPECCNIAAQSYEEVINNRQIFWLCKSCSNLMNDIRLRRTVHSAYESGQENVLSKHNEIVENLKCEILSELKKEIRTNFATLLNSKSLTPKSSKQPSTVINKSVRRRIFEKQNSIQPAQPILCGTAESLSPSFQNFVVPPIKRFWLYLSRISRDVTAEQVRKLVVDRLGTEDADVVRLVAAGRDINTMSFISFKVALNSEMKEKALSPSTWPKGILFREFKNSRSNDAFWQPRQNLNQISFMNSSANNILATPTRNTIVE